MSCVSFQFLAGVNHKKINLPEALSEFVDWDKQIDFLNSTILHPSVLKYPLKYSYQIQFLKSCISHLERETSDIRDEFYETLVRLQEEQSKGKQEWVYRHYQLPGNDQIVTVKEAPEIISSGTTGLSCWEGGVFLADWMSQSSSLFNGKRVLELGSGTGVTGLIVAKSCTPKELVLSDCHRHVLNLLAENVTLNECQNIRVVDLNWAADVAELRDLGIDPEVVIAADVVYDDTIFAPLLDVLLALQGRNRTVHIYLAATVRDERTLSRFLTLISDNGLHYSEICNSKDLQNRLHWQDTTEIKLFLIQGSVKGDQ